MVVLLVALTALDEEVPLTATPVELEEPLVEPAAPVLLLGAADVDGKADERLGSLCRLEEGDPLVALLGFLCEAALAAPEMTHTGDYLFSAT